MKFFGQMFFAVVFSIGISLSGNFVSASLFVSDWSGYCIYKYASDGTRTQFATNLICPNGIAFDRKGNLFVAERGVGNGAAVGTGSIYKFATDGTKSIFATGLSGLGGITFDRSGNLFATNEGSGINSGSIYKFAPDGTQSMFATGVDRPLNLAFDSKGNLFVCGDSGNIRKFSPSGTLDPKAFAQTMSARGMAFDSSDNLFVGRTLDVYKFTPDGTKSGFEYGTRVTSLAFDNSGNLFGGDLVYDKIYKFSPNGTPSVFASNVDTRFIAFSPDAPIPEPSTIIIWLLLGGLGLVFAWRRRKTA